MHKEPVNLQFEASLHVLYMVVKVHEQPVNLQFEVCMDALKYWLGAQGTS